MHDTLAQVYEISKSAKGALYKRNKQLLGADNLKEVRHYTGREAREELGVAHNTLVKYCKVAGIDHKRFQVEGAKFLITINDLYVLQDLLRESGFNLAEKKSRSEKELTQIFALANQKGGAGKTSTAVTIASCMATNQEHGRLRIGLVDTDAQGTMTMYYASGRNDDKDLVSFGDLMLGEYDIPEGKTKKDVISAAFLETTIPNMRILPSKNDDKVVEGTIHKKMALGELSNPYTLLRDVLKEVEDEFDIIIIDTPPTMNYPVYNALMAATSLIIPLSPNENDRDATMNWVEGLPIMYETLFEAGFNGYNDDINFLINNYDKQQLAIKEVRSINEVFGTYVMNTPLNSSQAIKVCSK
jgi:chromosome partitioning protein